jgi:hypothetical protein
MINLRPFYMSIMMMRRRVIKKLVAGQKKGCSGKNMGGGGGGRRVSKMMPFYGGFFNFIFYPNKSILVTLHPKTTSFWVFHPFSWFHLTEGAIL